MRSTQFEVPVDAIQGFAELLEEHGITNCINGTNDDGEIIVEIDYEPSERDVVMELTEFLDDHHAGNQE